MLPCWGCGAPSRYSPAHTHAHALKCVVGHIPARGGRSPAGASSAHLASTGGTSTQLLALHQCDGEALLKERLCCQEANDAYVRPEWRWLVSNTGNTSLAQTQLLLSLPDTCSHNHDVDIDALL